MGAKDAKKLIRSATSRMFRIGGLAGRVGISMAGNAVAGLFRGVETSRDIRADLMLKNALKVKDMLGQLKGVPMKIGQMVSLHERLFPPEVARVLQTLQQNAPSVPFEELVDLIRNELGSHFRQIRYIDEDPLAAASIGQVHRAVLKDGREIALKIQYPGIDEVIRADLKNLKGLLKLVFSMFSRMDMEPVWQELNARLLEELDYTKEAAHMKRMARLYADDPTVRIPEVIDELSSRHVLGMELVTGIPPDAATAATVDQELKNVWAKNIFRLILKGLFQFRFLHADPNIANFAFREDGGIIVYDFGCMKEIPEALARGYGRLIHAVLDHDYPNIPAILKDMGVHRIDGSPLPWQMIADFADLFQEIMVAGKCYTFDSGGNMYDRLFALGYQYLPESMNMVFPKDVVFIDRTFSGHFGNLCRLNASADWRAILMDHLPETETP
jgi:predicted unusual protein kinase regulating ubiquinone biosynthesis (AarF/ABC1/UbiB family)